jgi:hypothetical protein
MLFIEIFVIFVMTVIIIMFIQSHYGEVEYVKSQIDNRYYLVRKLPDMQYAADFLADVNRDLVKLVRHTMAKHPDREGVEQMWKNYNPDAISEGSIESGYTSYSVNKGEKLILCIRQQDKSFVKKNVIMYVAIHELSHIMTSEVGHTDMFWINFKFLLEEAMNIGLYFKDNYGKKPEEYCGIKITSSVV